MPDVYIKDSLHVADLEIGDVCKMDCEGEDHEFSTCIVQNVDETHVHFFRPYGRRESWTYTGGTICTIGIEQYKVERSSKTFKYFVYRRMM